MTLLPKPDPSQSMLVNSGMPLSSMPKPSMPRPSAEALAHSLLLVDRIADEIQAAGGWISFDRYMQLALYAPGLGYYSGGAAKFGSAGDFVTAPELSPLFARTIARTAVEVLQACKEKSTASILELGAGSGALAADLLLELQSLGCLPTHYFILEVSAQLRERQQISLEKKLPPELMPLVSWLETLPETFIGLVLANEVLDALPVQLLSQREHGLQERGVVINEEGFAWEERALTSGHALDLAGRLNLSIGYTTELCPSAPAFVASLSATLAHGVLLMIDYGFPRAEYYHAHRSEGTLMCHYRHYAHGDPFLYPGLQDITAHVDFTSIAEAGEDNGMQLLGYCGQAQFLINCGITDILAQVSPQDVSAYLPLASQAQTLLSPAEMGELFKVIALGKNYEASLTGFARGDKSHTL